MVDTLKNLESYHIVLCSQSPRRLELLSRLGLVFEVRNIPDIDESYSPELDVEEVPLFLSKKKAEAYRRTMNEDDLLITADTIVCLDNQIFGKPKDTDDARVTLKRLSGKTHSVITGITITSKEKQKSFIVKSRVSFANLSNQEIDYYIREYNPMDKAGAYGIQDWIGMIGIKSIEGSFYNVMGLPVQRLYSELKNF